MVGQKQIQKKILSAMSSKTSEEKLSFVMLLNNILMSPVRTRPEIYSNTNISNNE